MKHLPTVARYFLGAIYFIFGLNGFFQFIPMPPPAPEAGAFLGALASTGYMFPFIKITEIACGAAFLSGKFTALALVVSAPVTLNILLFHIFLAPDPMGTGMAVAMTAASLFLAKTWMDKYKVLLQA